jgi:hypothetical protein
VYFALCTESKRKLRKYEKSSVTVTRAHSNRRTNLFLRAARQPPAQHLLFPLLAEPVVKVAEVVTGDAPLAQGRIAREV